MAHFAELDENNIVKRVVVINNDEIVENGIEIEQKGINFCELLFGGRWIQTSYNGKFRKNYAGEGYLYDVAKDAFIPPKPLDKICEFDEELCIWKVIEENVS